MPTRFVLLALPLLLLGLVGCKEATLGPNLTGSIEGTVMDYDTNETLAGVSITTSPPTGAYVTDAGGAFTLEDLETGNYTITANKPGYQKNAVTVSVKENRTTQAVIFLEMEEEEDSTQAAVLPEVIDWTNVQRNDSVFVHVEYRVRNTGDVPLQAYEVYFRIETTSNDLFHEVAGSSLAAGQTDVGEYEKHLTSGEEAQNVVVDDFWVDE